jgi:GntR family transcriptional regulator
MSGAIESPSDQPLYIRIGERLEAMLADMEPGSFLPSEPKLARFLGVSRATLREAMRPFEQQGLIVRRQGVGTYVAEAPRIIESGLEVLESIESMAGRIGLEVQMGELAIENAPPRPEERADFDVGAQGQVVRISRLMQVKGRPVAFLVDVLPQGVLLEETLHHAFTGSVLDLLLRQREPQLSHSRTEITAIAAPPEIGRALQIQRGDVLLRLKARLFSTRGEVVAHSESFFLPGIFRFHVNRRAGRSRVGRR